MDMQTGMQTGMHTITTRTRNWLHQTKNIRHGGGGRALEHRGRHIFMSEAAALAASVLHCIFSGPLYHCAFIGKEYAVFVLLYQRKKRRKTKALHYGQQHLYSLCYAVF